MHSDLHSLVDRHGVFLRGEALDLGYSDRAIAREVAAGRWRRVRHGSYTFGGLWTDEPAGQLLLRSRAAYRTADTEVALSHTSSLMVHGTAHWGLPLTDVHLTRLDAVTGRRAAGVVQHRGQVLAGDLEYDGELAYTSATRMALEIVTLTDVERALVVVNDLLHRGLTTRQALEHRSVEMVTWPFSRRTELVLRYCDPRVESVGETRTQHALRCQGLPAPEPQLEVRDASGRLLGRVDFAWPELGVFVEFDGRSKYVGHLAPGETAADVVLREKARQELICEATGWICLRVTWLDLQQPAVLAARIRRAFVRQTGRLGA